MRRLARHVAALLVGAVAAFGAAPATAAVPNPGADPLEAEVARLEEFVRTNPDRSELWEQVRPGAEQGLARVRRALGAGQRFLALLRLSGVHENLVAMRYVAARTAAQRQEKAAFEAEWRRVGAEIASARAGAGSEALAGIRPAVVRAIGEAGLPQVGVYYDASLEYGRSTTPDSGLYYLGAALSRRDFAAFVRGLTEAAAGTAPPVRPLGPELDALEGELLAAYRPPASIDSHPQFITASATLKEARELDAAGLRYGALLRYLQAAQRVAMIRATTAPDADAVRDTLARAGDRLVGPVDHSVARLFVEAAAADLADPPAGGPVLAATVAADVLPRYFAALLPAPPVAPRPDPAVTVTLVRWPYT